MEDVFAGSGGDPVIKSAERCFVGGSSRSVANGEEETTTCVGDARASTGSSIRVITPKSRSFSALARATWSTLHIAGGDGVSRGDASAAARD